MLAVQSLALDLLHSFLLLWGMNLSRLTWMEQEQGCRSLMLSAKGITLLESPWVKTKSSSQSPQPFFLIEWKRNRNQFSVVLLSVYHINIKAWITGFNFQLNFIKTKLLENGLPPKCYTLEKMSRVFSICNTNFCYIDWYYSQFPTTPNPCLQFKTLGKTIKILLSIIKKKDFFFNLTRGCDK